MNLINLIDEALDINKDQFQRSIFTGQHDEIMRLTDGRNEDVRPLRTQLQGVHLTPAQFDAQTTRQDFGGLDHGRDSLGLAADPVRCPYQFTRAVDKQLYIDMGTARYLMEPTHGD